MGKSLVYRRGVGSGDKIALTFDDGPNPPRTEQVLEILADANARATFFFFGKWVEQFPASARRVLDAGHLIGNHGYFGEADPGGYDVAEAIIGNLTGRPTRFFRAHQFDYDVYYKSAVTWLPGSVAIDSNVRAMDWLADNSAEIARRVLEHPDLGPGAIITLHDGGEMADAFERLLRPLPMIAALPQILQGLKARGLRPVGLDELELVEPFEWNDEAGGA